MPFVGALTCKLPVAPQPPNPDAREPCTNHDPLKRPFFGDLHVHTNLSLDADLQGTRTSPDEAYQFAKGEIAIQPYGEDGVTVPKLATGRELDFTMVADHAEFFGEASLCNTPGSPVYDSLACLGLRSSPADALTFIGWNARLQNTPPSRSTQVCGQDGQLCLDASVTFWDEIQEAAEAAYDRTSACSFTSFVGYEWTGSPGSRNLHRNVVFRGKHVPTRPTSYFEAPHPEQLWDALENDCEIGTPGCQFLTIPHNSNLSNGTYFSPFDIEGAVYDQATAMRRQRMEPLMEVIQHKGQSECTYGVFDDDNDDMTDVSSSPNDELCGFEVLPYDTLQAAVGVTGTPKKQDFAREALRVGLSMQRFQGGNPFKFGMVGSTDTHLGTPGAVSEEGYPGHGGAGAVLSNDPLAGLLAVDDPSFNPGGLTVIWAEENSRESLFAAMERREVYATSGTRPEVRFFASRASPRWDASLCDDPNMIEKAYAEGVPMGGDIGPEQDPVGGSPSFLIDVLKDPQGTDLQRVQIVKISVPATGSAEETVYDIVDDWDNGADVDLDTCEPTGAGLSHLCEVWQDPNYSPTDAATLYYVRVIENPTCRWNQYQCNAAGVDCAIAETYAAGTGFEACCDGSVPTKVQERAWTSPIWYNAETSEEPPPSFTLEETNTRVSLCAGGAAEDMTLDLNPVGSFSNLVTLTAEFLPPGVEVSFSENPVTPPAQVTAQISATASAEHQGLHFFLIRGTAFGATDEVVFGDVTVFDQAPGPAALFIPLDGQTNEFTDPGFNWIPGVQTQGDLFEISDNNSFSPLVESGVSEDGSFDLTQALQPNTTHYWRVRGQNACGPGATSATFSFTTGSIP